MPARPRTLTPDRSARHLFGAKMRAYRGSMSLERLAEIVNFSKSHLARVETAESMPPPELPAALDAVFDTYGIFVELYQLARKEIHPDKYRRRMELETQARLIRQYTPQIVPGLAQTEDYARALFEAYNPRATQNEIDDLVTVRLSRQAQLREDPEPDISFILDEGVIRRSFGGPKVMRAQLDRLAGLALTSTTTVQILPFSHGGHGLMGGTLTLMTLRDGTQVAYEESISTGTLLEDVTDFVTRNRAYDLLSASAMSPADSVAFIRSVMEALPDDYQR
ncbi:helix-turn-helix transcriptional regulator [Streptomyces roseoverticillatus]|uniref:Helix-turn-helix transcriptional regulator n=1 Tax=Streptomyces roseoverticillatus TaxID=66429 RepID=A0ABV3J1W2_9ACTN